MRNQPRSRTFVAAACLVLLAAACGAGVTPTGGETQPPSGGEPIRVGLIAPMSGELPIEGEYGLNGAILAVEDAQAQGLTGGREIIFTPEDDACTASLNLEAVHKLIDVDKVQIYSSMSCSGALLTGAAYAAEKGVPIVNSQGSSPLIRASSKWIVSILGADDVLGRQLGAWAVELGFKNAAIISANTTQGVGLADNVRKGFIVDRDHVVSSFTLYNKGQLDYRPEVQRIVSGNPDLAEGPPDVIIGMITGDDALLIYQQVRQAGLNVPFILAYQIGTPYPKDDASGKIYTLDFGVNLPKAKEFQNKYAVRFNKDVPPNATFMYSYDGIMIAILAAVKAGPGASGEEIRAAIPEVIKTYDGVTGKIELDSEDQRINTPYNRFIYREGEWELIP